MLYVKHLKTTYRKCFRSGKISKCILAAQAVWGIWLLHPDLLTVWQEVCLNIHLSRAQLTEGIPIYFRREEEEVLAKGMKWYKWIRNCIEAFIKLNEKAPYGHVSGQMNRLLKINPSNYCLSPLWVSPARLGTQSKGADAEEAEEWQLHVWVIITTSGMNRGAS